MLPVICRVSLLAMFQQRSSFIARNTCNPANSQALCWALLWPNAYPKGTLHIRVTCHPPLLEASSFDHKTTPILTVSSSFHLFSNHSERIRILGGQLDYVTMLFLVLITYLSVNLINASSASSS